MALPAYYFPSSTLKAQSAASAAWEGGVAVPMWTRREVYNFNNGTISLLPLPPGAGDSPTPPPNVSRTGHGYYGAAADGIQGVWVSADGGLLTYLPVSGTASGFTVSIPASGDMLVGLAVAGSASGGNNAYAIGADGQVFITTSASPGSITTISPGFNTLCKGGSADGTYVYTAFSNAGTIGRMAIAGHGVSSITTALTPGIVSASSIGVAFGGWTLASVASGATDFAALPGSRSTIAAFSNSNNVALLTGIDPVWGVSSVATGLTSCSSIAWNQDGSQILASVSGGVTVLGIFEGAFVVDQQITLSGSGSVSVTTDGTNALVCRSGSNSVAVLINSLDIWTIGTPISVTNPTAVLVTGVATAWVISNTNLYPINRAGNTWTLGVALPLGFTGVALGSDSYGNVYVTGGTGTTGFLAMVSFGTIVDTVSWSGSGHGISITAEEGQLAVLLSDNQTIRAFGALNGLITQQGVMALTAPTGCSFLGSTNESVWLCGSSVIWQSWWTKPYHIDRFKVGEVGAYNGATVGYAVLGIGHDPSAIAWDVSGNIWCATVQNDLYSFAGTVSAGQLTPLTYQNIPVYTGQLPGTPMGISSLSWFQGGLYATTLFPGALIQVQ